MCARVEGGEREWRGGEREWAGGEREEGGTTCMTSTHMNESCHT